MEITISEKSIELLASKIAEKLGEPCREKEVDIKQLSEIIGEPVSNIYRWTSQVSPPVPHRKRGKQLRFLVSEVRSWRGRK